MAALRCRYGPLAAYAVGMSVSDLLALPDRTRIHWNPPHGDEGGVFGAATARDGGGYLITGDDVQVWGVWPDDDDHD